MLNSISAFFSVRFSWDNIFW